MSKDIGSVQARAYDLLKVMISKPLNRLLWKATCRKALKIAKYMEEIQYK